MRQLVAFVTARLDEDEQAATACSPGDRPPADTLTHALTDFGAPLTGAAEPSAVLDADGRHTARHSPARTLRHVAAQRRLLLELTRPRVAPTRAVALQQAVKACAARDADHPDYDPTWTM